MAAGRGRPGLRVAVVAASLIVGLLFVGAAWFLPEGSRAAVILFGAAQAGAERGATLLPYPFSMQNFMWIVTFWGFGEIWLRIHRSRQDRVPLADRLLPEDAETMLRASDLGPIYQRVQQGGYADTAFLPRLIRRTILQFQSSRSVDQANSLLNSTLELCQHEIDLRYNLLRYLIWLIPTLGFLGTVIGIADALLVAGKADFADPEAMTAMMPTMTGSLGVAFYTTLLALLQSALLLASLQFAQAREERTLNRAGQYCLDNLINRLYDK